jgi:hypothetical protein
MGRSKAVRKHLFHQCEFEFDFMPVHRGWSWANLIAAVELGNPLRQICTHLELDYEQLSAIATNYILTCLHEDNRRLTPRQCVLMEEYYDHTVLGQTLGELLHDSRYADPQAWLEDFAGASVYLHDNGYGALQLTSSSTLSEADELQIVERIFGALPLRFDQLTELAQSEQDSIQRQWSWQGSKSGAVMQFFHSFLRQNEKLRPSPGDILTDNRRARTGAQLELFHSIAKSSVPPRELATELRLYEAEYNVAFTNYVSAKLEAADLIDQPGRKRKGTTLMKLAGMLTLTKCPELRLLLFDHMVKGPGMLPFNFEREAPNERIRYEDFEAEMDDQSSIPENRPTMYIMIMLMVEVALRAFFKDKLKEATAYFGDRAFDLTQETDPEDEEELLALKQQLLLPALYRTLQHEQSDKLTSQPTYSIHASPFPPASDKTFAQVYRWIYDMDKAIHKDRSLFRREWKELLRGGQHKAINTQDTLCVNWQDFTDSFTRFTKIKPEDLGGFNLDKLDKLLELM